MSLIMKLIRQFWIYFTIHMKALGQLKLQTDIKMIKVTDNKDKYGKRYCPCSLIRDEDTVCMCKEFREMEEGTCHCQLYVKTKE